MLLSNGTYEITIFNHYKTKNYVKKKKTGY